MLSQIIEYLQTKIATLPYLEEVNGLGELIIQQETDPPVRFPAYYQSGELQMLDFDTHETKLAFFLDGSVQRETTENALVACAYRVKETYLLKALLYKQETGEGDCSHQAEKIAWNIAKLLTGKHPELMDSTSLDVVIINTLAINLDKHAIWRSLYSLPDALQEDDILLEIKLKIETEGDEACYVPYPCPVLTVTGAENNSIIQTQGGSLINA